MSASGASPVYLNQENDPAMDEANRKARQTFRYFWREVSWERRRIVPGLELACVKVAFSDPPGTSRQSGVPAVEQMWISDVNFDGQRLSGTLINQPNWLKSVKEGDAVCVLPKQVNDWMYAFATSPRVYGAYTVNLLRSRMGRAERAQHDKLWGLDFGDPSTLHIVPPDYFDKKPSLLAKVFGGERPVEMSELEGKEHPMAANMGPSLEETLKERPHFVHEADDQGFTLLHSLALAGTTIGVQVMLRHGANVNAVTKNGMTPLRLAKSLGWNRVAQTLEAAGGK